MAMSRTLRTTLKCMCHLVHIFRCSYSSRATRRLFVDNGCSSPELCNPIQYCLACRNLSIRPDVKMSSKNTLHYSGGIIVLKKRFHSKCSRFFRPALHDDKASNPSTQQWVFHRTTYLSMVLNLNRLIVSAPSCIYIYIYLCVCVCVCKFPGRPPEYFVSGA
jgi:hypothetical protein